jgi:UDP-4-amino-4,6-dideoxy-N-acetyl-beta-L-altrosamine transaminase
LKTIPYGRQELDDDDVNAVVATLRSDFLTQGPVVPRFEAEVAALCGAEHAVAGSNATAMLHIACMALGLGKGDVLWTVPNTFVASANCALYCGASVDFIDIDPCTWNMSIPALRDRLSRSRRMGSLPKIVVPVDFGGQPAEIEEIAALAKEFGFRILEDASHAIGASRHAKPTGNCDHADVVVFSFHPVKIVTTGEGGMALTADPWLARRMQLLRSHGITRDPSEMESQPAGDWYYEQIALGFNYRMTELQAALGLSQLRHLERFVVRRNDLAERYKSALAHLPVRWQEILPGNRSAYHLFAIRLDGTRCKRPHREVFARMREAGIGVNLHYMPVHLQPYFRRLGFAPGYCPEAERYGAEAITLPLFPAMTESEQDRIVAALEAATG